MKKFLVLFLLPLIFINCKREPSKEAAESNRKNKEVSVVEKIAKANGVGNFEKVNQLTYTFNVEINDSLVTERIWEWRPKDREVTLQSKDSSTTYNYDKEASKYPEIDQKFINDQYWLIFPFHLVWDEMEYEHNQESTAPISGETLQQVTIKYPQNAGYTPGDVYEIYFNEDFMIREWAYRPGGREEDPFVSTWEDYQDFNGIKIATMHQGEERNFKLYFTNVDVE